MANYFRGSTTKNALGYACGEKMVFELELVHGGSAADALRFGVPLFKWECFGDDGEHTFGSCSGENGVIRFETSISKPGFVHVIVTACAVDGTPLLGIDKFEGGAGAEIASIEQAVPDPEDFDEFWKKQREKLETIEPELLMKTEVASGNDGYVAYDVKIKAYGNAPVSAVLTMPKNAEKNSLKGQVSFHGYGLDSSRICCIENTVCIDVNVHGYDNFKPQEYYDSYGREHSGFGFERDLNKNPETSFFRDLILRGIQAVRFMRTLPEYDGKGFLISGGSMGAMQSVNVAANIDDARGLDIFIPWLCDLGGITVGRLRGWRPELDEGLRYYDTVSQAKRVKCPVKIVCGLGDYVCPPSGEVVLWKNFNTEKSIRFVQNMTHPYRPIEEVGYEPI